MAENIEGVVGLVVQRDQDGRSWVEVDSLVDLFADMAAKGPEGPVRNSFQVLSETFREMSSYDQLQSQRFDDGVKMVARRCATGDAVVVDGQRIAGDAIVIDAEPVPDGELIPLRIRGGVPTVGPWSPANDGLSSVRLHAHSCSGERPA